MNGKRTNPDSLPNIKRIDTRPNAKRQSHGFQVHFERDGKAITKWFSDGSYRSKHEAKLAAIAFRDALKPTLSLTYYERGYRTSSQSNTGYSGISYTFDRRVDIPHRRCFSVSVMHRFAEPINRKFYVDDPADYDAVLKKAVAWKKSVLRKRRLLLASKRKQKS